MTRARSSSTGTDTYCNLGLSQNYLSSEHNDDCRDLPVTGHGSWFNDTIVPDPKTHPQSRDIEKVSSIECLRNKTTTLCIGREERCGI